MQNKANSNTKTALIFSAIIMLFLLVFILFYGKKESFLIINSNHSSEADFFFKYFTHAGDGLMWIPAGILCLIFKRKYAIAVIAGIIISTLLTHLMKRVIFPDELRPITYLSENFPVHTVSGVKINTNNSFPSGHTATAFTIAYLLVFLTRKKYWAFILPLLALLVAYSRVYLAQHFVTDVTAGMATGILSGILSIWIYRRIAEKKQQV